MKFAHSALQIALAALLCVALPAGAEQLSNGNGDLRLINYNVHEGTDYKQVQRARNSLEFLIAVGQTITQVRATDPKLRMQYVAKQILSASPALVSVEELGQWATGPFNPATGQCGAVAVEYDMLPELMNALREQGGHYEIAVQAKNWNIP